MTPKGSKAGKSARAGLTTARDPLPAGMVVMHKHGKSDSGRAPGGGKRGNFQSAKRPEYEVDTHACPMYGGWPLWGKAILAYKVSGR